MLALSFIGVAGIVAATIFLNRRIAKQCKFLQTLEEKEYNLNKEYLELSEELLKIKLENKFEQQKLNSLLSEIENVIEAQKKTAQKAFESYADILDKAYINAEEEYNKNIISLNVDYDNIQKIHNQKLQELTQEIGALKATRDAAIAAQLREKEIQNQHSFYCLQIEEKDKSDVEVLERIKPQLANPRVLSMLIWQTYFQKPMTSLCNNILGNEIVCGIYKITNQHTGESYIGQSVDVSKRWKDHIKCGLGIDTPAGNKLYKAMQKDGVWSFSWELLEKCSKLELNAKEKFYIELYNSYEYGYNSNSGVGK